MATTPPRQIRVLQAISQSPYPINSKELAEKLGYSYQVTVRDLQELTQKKYVTRISAKGNGYTYKFKDWPKDAVAANQDVKELSVEEFKLLSRAALAPDFVPVVVKDYQIVVEVFKLLNEQAVEASQGNPVAIQSLKELKTKLDAYNNKLNVWRRLVGGLLLTDGLWEQATLGVYAADSNDQIA